MKWVDKLPQMVLKVMVLNYYCWSSLCNSALFRKKALNISLIRHHNFMNFEIQHAQSLVTNLRGQYHISNTFFKNFFFMANLLVMAAWSYPHSNDLNINK